MKQKNDKKTLFFSVPTLQHLAGIFRKSSLKFQNGRYKFEAFANKEALISLLNTVRKRNCVVLGTVTPPSDQMIEMLLLCHSLKKEGASSLTALLPYLAYMRQDKKMPGESLASDWLAKLFKASGIDRVVTLDVHSAKAGSFLTMPFISLSTAEIFTREIQKIRWQNATLVAPDEGAVNRCKKIQSLLKSKLPIVHFQKKRVGQDVVSTFHGQVGSRAIVIDDMIDTGKTLLACCEILKKKGVKEIIIMVTHGLFTGNLWKRLWNLNVTRLYTTDTVPLIKKPKNVFILPAISLFINYLEKQNH